MTLIGINGKLGSGKTTFAELLLNQLGNGSKRGVIVNFADDLKNEASNYLAANGTKKTLDLLEGYIPEDLLIQIKAGFDEWENRGYSLSTMLIKEALYNMRGDEVKKLLRPYVQAWGTEYRRKHFGDNYWVEKTMKRIESLDKRGVSFVLLSDMRFPNEYEAVLDYPGITCRIVRPGLPKNEYSDHPSETSLDNHKFDIEITNSGTLQDLEDQARETYVMLTNPEILAHKA